MGLPKPYRKEDDPETWDKLTGKTEILFGEALGLARLFGVSMEYLFSHELKTVCGETAAHWRWFDEKEKIKADMERSRQIREIEQELREKPYLLEFMKEAVTWNDEQIIPDTSNPDNQCGIQIREVVHVNIEKIMEVLISLLAEQEGVTIEYTIEKPA